MSEPDGHQNTGPPEPGRPTVPVLGQTANSDSTRVRRRLRIKMSDVLAGLALIISVGSASISYQQLGSVRRQLQLTQLQIRPYMKYRPNFTQEGQDRLTVTMISENLSPIPANAVYSEVKVWIDETTTDAFLFNRTGDVLYQHKSGAMTLPPMHKEVAKAVISGKAQLLIGTCVVYGSISSSDDRRWEVRSLYSYAPNNELPTVQYIQEIDIAETVNRCDSRTLRSEWLNKKVQPPRVN